MLTKGSGYTWVEEFVFGRQSNSIALSTKHNVMSHCRKSINSFYGRQEYHIYYLCCDVNIPTAHPRQWQNHSCTCRLRGQLKLEGASSRTPGDNFQFRRRRRHRRRRRSRRQRRAAGPANASPGDSEGGDQPTAAQWGRHVLWWTLNTLALQNLFASAS